MKNKINILFGFLSLCFTLCSNGLAMQEEGREPWGFSGFAKKYLGCCTRTNHIVNEEQESLIKEHATEESSFKDFPLEVLHHILYKLSPLDIIHMTQASRDLNRIIDNKFWGDYLNIHQQNIWNHTLSPSKIAFAYSLYAQGKIDKAARLGLPSAIKILKSRTTTEYRSGNKIASVGGDSPSFFHERKYLGYLK